MSKFINAMAGRNNGAPPVWFMRQAGRYHSHYQQIRKAHTFLEMCRTPELACEVTLGPIQDFDFDAAILFSDILFPLEAMGMGLDFGDHGPKLDWYLRERNDLKKIKPVQDLPSFLKFQGDALKLLRARLAPEKALLGFVGGPMTLFFFATAGSHKGDLTRAMTGLHDGRFMGLMETLVPMIAKNMVIQAKAGADTVAIFDTAAGEISIADYEQLAVPALEQVMQLFRKECPETPVIYYSRGTGAVQWKKIQHLDIQCMGIDWNHSISQVLAEYEGKWAIQGNIPPDWLTLGHDEFRKNLEYYLLNVKNSGVSTQHWIAGLGHGVTPAAHQDNVRSAVQMIREIMS